MKWGCLTTLLIGLVVLIGGGWLYWYLHPGVERTEGVVYAERGGTNLTIDVVVPKSGANGAGVVLVVSGGWQSDPANIDPWIFAPLTRAGYTVFAVSHLSQPEATVDEIFEDVSRGVRWVRHHAGDYGVDPGRIGVTGGSAGGHLSLLLATRGGPGPVDAADEVGRASSAVQAVGIFFPVTDLLNLGESTENDGKGGPPKSYVEAFGEEAKDMKVWREEIGRELSPIYHVSAEMPPVLIIHGDEDTLTPLDQSTRFVEAAEAAGAEVELVVKPGKGHGWVTMVWDLRRLGEFFDGVLLEE